LAALAADMCFVSQALPQAGLPRFIGVHPFTGNMVTDPNWGTHSGIFGSYSYAPAVTSASIHTNSAGKPSILLMPSMPGQASDLYTAVPNGYDATGTNPVPHTLIVWHKDASTGSCLVSASVGGMVLSPSISGTTDWTETSWLVPAMTGAQLALSFTAIDMSTNLGGIYLDAVECFPAVADTNPSANFRISRSADGSLVVAWSTIYSNYYLAAACAPKGPYASPSYVTTTNGGYISTVLRNSGTNMFFRLQE